MWTILTARPTAPFAFALLLAGCAAPQPIVRSSGALPSEGSYGFGEGGAPPAPAATLLAEKLASHGLAPSDTPRYLVQAEYSRPPAKTGTVVADRPEPQWLRAPVKGRARLSHISVSMTEVATGTEVYRTAAWQPVKGKADDSALLMQAALNPPPPAPAR